MPEIPGREEYWNIGYPLLGGLVYFTLAIAAGAVFYGFYKRYSLWSLGKPTPDLGPWSQRLLRGLRMAFLDMLGHRRFLKGELYPGLMHFFLFWGATFLLIGTAIVALESNFHKYLPVEFPTSRFRVQEGFVWDIFGGVFVTIGLAMAVFRRYVLRPPRLNTFLEDTLVLTLIAALILTGFAIEGLRILVTKPASAWAEPVGYIAARIFSGTGMTPYVARVTHLWLYWLHVLLVVAGFVFLAIRFNKLTHIVVSPLNALLHSGRPKGSLRPLQEAKTVERVGASELTDFTKKQLLELDACTNCGRCQDKCPAYASGRPLSPRRLVQDLKAYMEVRGRQLLNARRRGAKPGPAAMHMVHQVVTDEVLWSCTTCRACMEACPVFLEHIDTIVDMRRYLVYEGSLDTQLQTVLMNLSRYGNSFGQSERNRARWAQGLEFKLKDATREPVDYLWFVGDYASYDPAVQPITRAVARVFQGAGLDFGILHGAERNTGNDVRRAGEEGLFEALVEHNTKALGKCQFKRIVTTDPHTLNTLRNEYSSNGNRWEALHYSQLLAQLLRKGQLVPRPLGYTATYHDPCYLGRYNGIYEEPRQVLRALGVRLVEMKRSRSNSYCCGAGGGYLWMAEKPAKERPAESRVREAVALGVDYLVVACPKDVGMFRDAVKTTGNEGKIQVKDLAELVEEACGAKAVQETSPAGRDEAAR